MAISLVPQALCTVDDVLQIISSKEGTSPGSGSRETIATFINLFSVSAETARFCNRQFEKAERIEYFDGNTDIIQVAASPILVASDNLPRVRVFDDPDRAFGPTTEITCYTDFIPHLNTGIIKKKYGCYKLGYRSVKVVYTAGLVESSPDGSGPVDSPSDLRTACAIQVASWWQRRKEFALENISIPGGGSIRIMDPTKLLTHVREVLLARRRHRFWGQ